MEQPSRKRSLALEDADHQSRPKRRCTTTDENGTSSGASTSTRAIQDLYEEAATYARPDVPGRAALRRSITLALNHVGFDSATEVAMESFTELVETYMDDFIQQVKRVANGSRRIIPTPTDLEDALRHNNIAISALKPHLRNPIPKKLLEPTYFDVPTEDITDLEAPPRVLGDALDGKYEKRERSWIPKHFPNFPSKHTYRYTPAKPPAKDTEEKRLEALADARKSESALRRIERAAKYSRHKELTQMAKRDRLSKKRHEAWEVLMQDFLSKNPRADIPTEVADHSTVVNAGAKYGRKELPRSSRRAPPEGVNGHA